jgi:hypothetical protein
MAGDSLTGVNTYSLLAPDGRSFGPVDQDGLIRWAREGRIVAASQIRCVETGVVTPAGSLQFLAPVLIPPPVAVAGSPPALAAPPPIHPLPGAGGTLTPLPVAVVILLHFVTCGIFPTIWFGLMHGKLPKTRPDDPSAGQAVGFMFIPFFNLYWVFFSYIRLCDRIDEQRIRHGLAPNNLRGLAIATCIVIVIPYVNLLGALILDPIFFGVLQATANELAAASSPAFVRR